MLGGHPAITHQGLQLHASQSNDLPGGLLSITAGDDSQQSSAGGQNSGIHASVAQTPSPSVHQFTAALPCRSSTTLATSPSGTLDKWMKPGMTPELLPARDHAQALKTHAAKVLSDGADESAAASAGETSGIETKTLKALQSRALEALPLCIYIYIYI